MILVKSVFSLAETLTNSNARVAVNGLNQLFALVTHHPVGVDLGCAFGVQRNHLELAEVRLADVKVLWTHVNDVGHVVLVEVVFAGVATTIA